MLFRRKSKRDRVLATGRKLLPSRRTVAAVTAWVVGGAAALAAASSTVSAVRQKQD